MIDYVNRLTFCLYIQISVFSVSACSIIATDGSHNLLHPMECIAIAVKLSCQTYHVCHDLCLDIAHPDKGCFCKAAPPPSGEEVQKEEYIEVRCFAYHSAESKKACD